MDKKGEGVTDGIRMIYKLVLFSGVAIFIFGFSAFSYNYNINIRSAEAMIMARDVSSCLTGGVLNLQDIPSEDYGNILSYCGIPATKRFYVGVDVVDSSGHKIAKFHQGDSGMLWIKTLFKNSVSKVDNSNKMIKFSPGYFNSTYPVSIINDGKKIDGHIKVEVLLKYDK